MAISNIFKTLDPIRSALDASAMREGVIANNIANGSTPNFKTSQVQFESVLREAIDSTLESKSDFITKRTRAKHFDFNASSTVNWEDVRPTIVQNDHTNMRLDDNNVDVEYEMSEAAKNQIYYSTLIQQANRELARLRLSISEGR